MKNPPNNDHAQTPRTLSSETCDARLCPHFLIIGRAAYCLMPLPDGSQTHAAKLLSPDGYTHFSRTESCRFRFN